MFIFNCAVLIEVYYYYVDICLYSTVNIYINRRQYRESYGYMLTTYTAYIIELCYESSAKAVLWSLKGFATFVKKPRHSEDWCDRMFSMNTRGKLNLNIIIPGENHSRPNGLTTTDFPLEICLHYFSLPIRVPSYKKSRSRSSVNRLFDVKLFHLNSREVVIQCCSCKLFFRVNNNKSNNSLKNLSRSVCCMFFGSEKCSLNHTSLLGNLTTQLGSIIS